MTEPTTGGLPAEPGLTPTEKRLLDTLQQAPGRIFSRQELLSLVIPDAIVLERTIDVHIRALRSKLGNANRIRTVRRRGYLWDDGATSASH